MVPLPLLSFNAALCTNHSPLLRAPADRRPSLGLLTLAITRYLLDYIVSSSPTVLCVDDSILHTARHRELM